MSGRGRHTRCEGGWVGGWVSGGGGGGGGGTAREGP